VHQSSAQQQAPWAAAALPRPALRASQVLAGEQLVQLEPLVRVRCNPGSRNGSGCRRGSCWIGQTWLTLEQEGGPSCWANSEEQR
jgi:hypothetical protein